MIKKLLKVFLCLIIIIILLLAAGRTWLTYYAQNKLSIQENTIFTLPAGTGRTGLSELLKKEGIVSETRPLIFLFKLKPELSKIKAGTYLLTPDMTIEGLLQLLNQGKEMQFDIRFVEGNRFKEWRQVLANSSYIRQTLNGKSDQEVAKAIGIPDGLIPEGWLAPDTYYYTANTSDIMILQRAYHKMRTIMEKAWDERDADLPYKTPYEMLIMASIIEKETSVASERPLVASVFVNRLNKGMRLQTDPTVIYGIGDMYDNKITRTHLNTPTPYNTYTNDGLPPTPIAMPGEAAVYAAAHPAKTNYIFFVATGNGGHTFTSNLKEHNKAVQEYRNTTRSQK